MTIRSRHILAFVAAFMLEGCFHSGFAGDPTTDPNNPCAKTGYGPLGVDCGDGTCCGQYDYCGDGQNSCPANSCCGTPYVPPDTYWLKAPHARLKIAR
jgi:hypothetical protein